MLFIETTSLVIVPRVMAKFLLCRDQSKYKIFLC